MSLRCPERNDMKTVVITGGTRGLGLRLAEQFKRNDYNVVLCGTKEETVRTAEEALQASGGRGGVLGVKCNVTDPAELEALAQQGKDTFGTIDIWVNNAGVNQSPGLVWELTPAEIDSLLATDLKGVIYGSQTAVRIMREQGFGAIYNVEGMGSNDAFQPRLTLYGTAKRAVTYFTDALAKELDSEGVPVIAGKLSPGIMITDFLTSANGQQGTTVLSEKEKKVYNILGDYPETVAEFLVGQMLTNRKNGARIEWLTKGKAFFRFLTASFRKRDFFE